MFVLKEDKTFEWPVEVEVPKGKGKFDIQIFTAIFDPISTDTLEGFLALPLSQQDTPIARAALQGWGEDVAGEDGEPLSFTEEAKEQMLTIPYVRLAVVKAYFDAMNGRASRKN